MPTSSAQVEKLINAARAVHGGFSLGRDFTAGTCAAAIESASGEIFTGICIDVACGIGFCAEHAAVAEMLKARQTRFVLAVAVNKHAIVYPCGRCRELMAQINPQNLDAEIIIQPYQVIPLRELLPNHWLDTTSKTVL